MARKKKTSTNGRRQCARVQNVEENNALHQALTASLQRDPQQVRSEDDARSNVLIGCTQALIEMQTTIQAIAQASIQAPNFTNKEERI